MNAVPKTRPGLARVVKAHREQRAWTQQQLADVAEINIRTIQRLENSGNGGPETLMAVAQAFDMDVKQLNLEASSMEAGSNPRYTHLLPRLVSGSDLTAVVSGADRLQFEHDGDEDPRSVSAMQGILQLVKADSIRLYDATPNERLAIESELSQEFQGLEGCGYLLFGTKRVIPNFVEGQGHLITLATIYLSHSRSPRIVKDGSKMVIPALLTEVGHWNPETEPRRDDTE